MTYTPANGEPVKFTIYDFEGKNKAYRVVIHLSQEGTIPKKQCYRHRWLSLCSHCVGAV